MIKPEGGQHLEFSESQLEVINEITTGAIQNGLAGRYKKAFNCFMDSKTGLFSRSDLTPPSIDEIVEALNNNPRFVFYFSPDNTVGAFIEMALLDLNSVAIVPDTSRNIGALGDIDPANPTQFRSVISKDFTREDLHFAVLSFQAQRNGGLLFSEEDSYRLIEE